MVVYRQFHILPTMNQTAVCAFNHILTIFKHRHNKLIHTDSGKKLWECCSCAFQLKKTGKIHHKFYSYTVGIASLV